MNKFSNILKTAAIAGLIGSGAIAMTSAPADAASYRRCDAYGCYRVTCDWRGFCHRSSGYYSDAYYAPRPYYDDRYAYRSVRVCDEWGCHWVRRSNPDVRVGIGLRF